MDALFIIKLPTLDRFALKKFYTYTHEKLYANFLKIQKLKDVFVTPQNVIITAKCNTNAKCNNNRRKM